MALSCKSRTCPSCAARRTSDTAARLVDTLLPAAPYRQWVLSFPWSLRIHLARDQALWSDLVSAFLHILFAWYRRRGRKLGIADGQCGAVTFLQRFGSALNCNPHAHSVLADGLFVPDPAGGPLTFVPLPPPTDREVEDLVRQVARRLTALAVRRLEGWDPELDAADEGQTALQLALADSLPGGIGTSGPAVRAPKPLCAMADGFSLHAARTATAEDRPGLERLCAYGLRSPFALERLSLLPDGRVRYELRRPWPTAVGVTELILEPVAFLRRLAALLPRPYTNLVRYHGVFANRSRDRARLPSPPPGPSILRSEGSEGASPQPQLPVDDPLANPAGAVSERAEPPANPTPPGAAGGRMSRRIPWAALLRRTLGVDALRCARCHATMVVLAFLTDPEIVTRILQHLGLPTAPPPIAPPRLRLVDDLFDFSSGDHEEFEPRLEAEAAAEADLGDPATLRGRGPPRRGIHAQP